MKKQYKTPHLEHFGAISELTAGGSGDVAEVSLDDTAADRARP